jgi:hypothetical protein
MHVQNTLTSNALKVDALNVGAQRELNGLFQYTEHCILVLVDAPFHNQHFN